MGKILTQAQKTFVDLYDSYVLNLSTDIVAVPCNHEGKSVDNYEVAITYNALADSNSVGVSCTGMVTDTVLEGVQYDIGTAGEITITVPKDTILPDDAETGFTFTTNNSSQFVFKKYITFIKINQGANGENARSFQIKSEQGDTFDEGISEITMTAIAFDGLTQVNNVTYAWYRYTNNVWVPVPVNSANTGDGTVASNQIYSEQSLTIYKADAHDNPVFKCVVTYSDGETDEDYFQLKNVYHNYESAVKFFGGTSTIAAYEPFVVAYVDLYKDHQKENATGADYYHYNKNNVRKSDGSFSFYFENVDSSHQVDGNRMYVIYKDESVAGESVPTQYTITAQAGNSEAGTVTGGGTFEYGSNITLTANPADNYVFDGWSDGVQTNPRSVTVTQSYIYTANFIPITTTLYTVSVRTTGPDNAKYGSAFVNNASSQTCEAGSLVTLTAVANAGYTFVDWYDESNVAQNWPTSKNITVTGNQVWTARFRAISSQSGIEDTITPNTNKSVSVSKQQIKYLAFTPTSTNTYKFYSASTVTLNGYLYNADLSTILASSEGVPGGDNFAITYKLMANQTYYFGVIINEDYTSNSATTTVRLITTTEQTDVHAVVLGSSEGGSVSGAGNHAAGTVIKISANANTGYEFAYWQDANGNQTDYTREFMYTVDNDLYLKAIFTLIAGSDSEQIQYIISTDVYPDTTCGSVSGGGTYLSGNWVNLVAEPAIGYNFVGWFVNGERVSLNANYSFAVSQTATYVAHFDSVSYNITVSVNNENWGAVSGGGSYPAGSSIEIAAIPKDGYTFSSWTDGNASNPRTIIVNGNQSYTANFTATDSQYCTITVVANDANWGTVSGGGSYPRYSQQVISATPNPGYRFDHWDDSNDLSANRTITVEKDATYMAIFAPAENLNFYNITVVSDPVGAGLTTGSGTYQEGTPCTISVATLDGNYTFSHWKITPTNGGQSTSVYASDYTFYPNCNATCTAIFVAAIDSMIYSGQSKNVTVAQCSNNGQGNPTDYTFVAFQPTVTGLYVFTCFTYDKDTYGALYNAEHTNRYKYNDNGPDETGGPFLFTHNCTAGSTYHFGVKFYYASAQSSDVTLFVTRLLDAQETIAEDIYAWVNLETQTYTTLKFIPQYSGNYTFDYYNLTSYKPYLAIQNSSNQTLTYGYTKLTYNFTAGTTYYLYMQLTNTAGMPINSRALQVKISRDAVIGNDGQIIDGVLHVGTTETIIGDTYSGNNEFHTVIVHGNAKSVSADAFADCTALTTVVLEEGVESVGASAFHNCTNLTYIYIPKSSSGFGLGAFYKTGLTTIYFAGNAAEWEIISQNTSTKSNEPFFNAQVVYNTTYDSSSGSGSSGGGSGGSNGTGGNPGGDVSENVLYIDQNVSSNSYREDSTFTSVIVRNGVTTIGQYSFYNCVNLKSVIFSDSVTHIQGYTFQSCPSLTTIIFGSGLEFVGTDAFAGCSALTDVYYAGSESQWNSIRGIENITNQINATGATIHYNYVSTYAAAPMMMRSAAPMTLALEDNDNDIATFANIDTDGRRAKYKAALCQYNAATSKWDVVSDNDTYAYYNDLYTDVLNKVIVVSKEDVTHYRSVDVTIYKKVLEGSDIVFDNDLIVSNTSFTVFDVNDPIIGGEKPSSANDGQLWLDTNEQPYVLYIYQNGEWVYFNQQSGKTIYTKQPVTYSEGDIWILEEDFFVGNELLYGTGTMLTAQHSVTVPGGFDINHWSDTNPNITNTIKDIKESFIRDEKGIKIVHTATSSSGEKTTPFYVHIDSSRMGFYSDDVEVVHIGNNSATVKNATFQGENTTFETDASFQQRVDIVNKTDDGTTSGFAFQTETDGSFSLIRIGT